ncbi:MAG: ABC transporter ATP-binding protein [Roseiarcus sp.]|jgi:peptide/nickel transport system ATP-binding protein
MLLEVSGLAIDLPSPAGARRVVHDVSFSLAAGESLGVVGESGSGKTMTALALMGLLPDGAVVSGAVRFEGLDLARLAEAEMQRLRGDRLAMIFQEPMSALNPLQRIGAQVAEPLVLHRAMAKAAAWAEAVRLLDRVRLRDPERIARAYPFALSGGERQRAMIAMALSCGPRLIIADEPTTALDVTVQAKILDLLASLGEQSNMATLLISHDLAVVARHCRSVLAMYGGTLMESGPVDAVLRRARHPYTRALLEARPRPGAPRGERLRAIAGVAPPSASALVGCPFAGRCPLTLDVCRTTPLPTIEFEAEHRVRCHRVDAEGRLT